MEKSSTYASFKGRDKNESLGEALRFASKTPLKVGRAFAGGATPFMSIVYKTNRPGVVDLIQDNGNARVRLKLPLESIQTGKKCPSHCCRPGPMSASG